MHAKTISWKYLLGIATLSLEVRTNLSLRAREYVISLKGVEIARYELAHGCEMAIHPGQNAPHLDGLAAKEPAFGIPAVWIGPESVEAARKAGYTVVDATSILGTHLGELIRRHALKHLQGTPFECSSMRGLTGREPDA